MQDVSFGFQAAAADVRGFPTISSIAI
jgi:hypothetical protein